MTKSKKLPLIIVADPGVDDEVAIFYIYASQKVDIKLIAVTGGNVGMAQTTHNTLGLLQMLGANNVPVAKCLSALDYEGAVGAHGKSGVGDYAFENVTLTALSEDAAEAMHKIVAASKTEVTLLVLSPVGEVAEYYKKYPEDKAKTKVVFSGGIIPNVRGEEEKRTSFNIYYDGEAMKELLAQNINLTVCPSNWGHDCYFDYEDIYNIKQTGEVGEMFEKMFRSYHDNVVKNGVATHDLCAAEFVTHPNFFKVSPAKTIAAQQNGKTILDFNFSAEPNSLVVTDAKNKKIKKEFFKVLKKFR